MKPVNRIFWGQSYPNLPPLELNRIQHDSWRGFLADGIKNSLSEINPVEDFTGKNWTLEFLDHSIEKPGISPQHALNKGLTFAAALRVKTRLTNKQTGKNTSAEVFLGDIPQMTNRGTFIINGVERAVINQLVRSPGVYFGLELDAASGRLLHTAELRPIRGTWLEFEISRANVISVRIDRRRKFVVTTLLRAMGLSDPDQLTTAFSQVDTDLPTITLKVLWPKIPPKPRKKPWLKFIKKCAPVSRLFWKMPSV